MLNHRKKPCDATILRPKSPQWTAPLPEQGLLSHMNKDQSVMPCGVNHKPSQSPDCFKVAHPLFIITKNSCFFMRMKQRECFAPRHHGWWKIVLNFLRGNAFTEKVLSRNRQNSARTIIPLPSTLFRPLSGFSLLAELFYGWD